MKYYYIILNTIKLKKNIFNIIKIITIYIINIYFLLIIII